ncbi:MAG: response regulator transcription factor [Planctomycetota bacterium]
MKIFVCNHSPVCRAGIESSLRTDGCIDVCGISGAISGMARREDVLRSDVILFSQGFDLDLAIEELRALHVVRPHIVLVLTHTSTTESHSLGSIKHLPEVIGETRLDISGPDLCDAIHRHYQRHTEFKFGRRLDTERTHSDGHPGPVVLSSREEEILVLLASGLTVKEVSGTLGISIGTVYTHRQNAEEKLGLHGIASLTRYAIKNDLLRIPKDQSAVQERRTYA